MSLWDDITQIYEIVITLTWLILIPYGLITAVFNLPYAAILLIPFLLLTIFGIFPLALKYGLESDGDLSWLDNRDMKREMKINKISIVIVILIFIIITYIGFTADVSVLY